jgi:hypothetical protein
MGEAVKPQDSYEVMQLEGEVLRRYWPMIVGELKKIPHTWGFWWTEDSLELASMNGQMQVWAVGPPSAIKLIAFSQVLHYPANRILQIGPVFGTDMDECFPVLAAVFEKFAVIEHCTFSEINGRPGLEKVMAPYGFKKYGVSLMRGVGPMRSH